MENKIITGEDGRIISFLTALKSLEKELDAVMGDYEPVFGGERYITDKELSGILKISRRTLQDYRDKGIIGFHYVGGKVIYRESDIRNFLEQNYYCREK